LADRLDYPRKKDNWVVKKGMIEMETLNKYGIWTWAAIMMDLKEQGGLEEVYVDPFSVQPHFCAGEYNRKVFTVSWSFKRLLMVSMKVEEYAPELIEAFSKVVEYRPFCKYLEKAGGKIPMVTVEWAKNDAEARFAELQEKEARGEIEKLERVN
jgi:hypothetical protein